MHNLLWLVLGSTDPAASRDKRTDYIRADSVSTRLQTASLLYSLVDFLVSCSCLSTPNLVSLVPSAQHPFWPLVPRPPELRAPSRPLKAGLCTARIRVTGTAPLPIRQLAGRADPVAVGSRSASVSPKIGVPQHV